MADSTQKKLTRVRPPRVMITYDVEIGSAIQVKELPFVAGILADLSGNPAEPLPRLKDRKFVEIDGDNFDAVMASCTPRLVLQVPNRLQEDSDSNLRVELDLSDMDAWNPLQLVQQVEPLRKLFETRQRLVDLMAKLDGNDKLDALLQQVVDNPDNQKALAASTAKS